MFDAQSFLVVSSLGFKCSLEDADRFKVAKLPMFFLILYNVGKLSFIYCEYEI